MTSKERVLRTLRHEEPDRPPVYSSLTPQIAERLASHLQLPLEPPFDSLFSNRISWPALKLRLGDDLVAVAPCYPSNRPVRKNEEGLLINEWGMTFKDAGLYWEFYKFPLAHAESVNDILSYSFPDPHAPGRYDAAIELIRKYGKEYAIIGELETTIFETCWYLVGLEKFLMDLMIEPPYLNVLLDTVMNINMEMGKELIRLGVDIIWCGDDFGSQTGCIMDPAIWRKHFKPRIQHIFSTFKKLNPDIKIAWHSCGSIVPLIPDFIEIGLDILNPLQPLAKGMDPVFLKKTYGDKLSFFGAICVQDLLPNGSPEKIKKEVKRIASILGKGGGYILSPAHNIQPDTPVENVLAMYEAVKEMGN